MSFTDEVKQELSGLDVDGDDARAELAALLRFGGALVVSGGTPTRTALDLETVSGATARRAYALLQRCCGLRPQLRVRAPSGVHRRVTYGLRVEIDGHRVAQDLGLVDAHGLPTDTPVPAPRAVATTRGAFLASGSISSPDRAPHLEIVAHHGLAAQQLAEAVRTLVEERTVTVSDRDGARPRVVLKSGAAIGELLAALGATSAFLRYDDRRLRRELRREATRLANADAANLRRVVEASRAQVRAVERVVAALGWDGLPDGLRSVALARLTNPEASLTELGQLADPPLSRSAVHRRLHRIEQLADEVEASRG